MDVLADVLEVTQMANTVMCQARFRAPWGVEVDPSAEAALHVVQRGSCWIRIEGCAPIMLSDGDIVLLARGNGHVISDSPDRAARPLDIVMAEMAQQQEPAPGHPEPAVTHILCAKYHFGLPDAHPLISRLPSIIHLRARDVAKSAQLQLLIQLMRIESEAGGSGGDLVVPRLVDSMLVFVLRVWLDGEPDMSASWFAALRDPGVGRALALIHRHPQTDWTVKLLAENVGQTRATFARRFAHLVGETPVAYLTRWRICLAAKLLKDGGGTVEQAAYSAGYDSAAAFSRAFKRHYGSAPARFRSLHAAP
jgi:AraC-like DNA-binding protein